MGNAFFIFVFFCVHRRLASGGWQPAYERQRSTGQGSSALVVGGLLVLSRRERLLAGDPGWDLTRT